MDKIITMIIKSMPMSKRFPLALNSTEEKNIYLRPLKFVVISIKAFIQNCTMFLMVSNSIIFMRTNI